MRHEVLDAKGKFCHYCGCDGGSAHLQLDHIVAHAKGGATSVVNLQPLCRDCKIWKGPMDDEDARVEFHRLVGVPVHIELHQAAQAMNQATR